ncbi:hypothetical protein JYU34_009064 [Plutella xylostella]|uniref:Ig-like domain-containing protein n=1 Tax=Plutella xylostella TaxID=51655 RepID=A0ABQ7QML1_PLUXY|nr:hypothetical protein JYU34_009064 [Plutella xylostella]
MQRTVTLLTVYYFCVQELTSAITITELRAPAQVAEGGEMILGCAFDLEGEALYSVKWYQDNREFYRFVPGNSPPASHFSAPGITVDMQRSSSDVVTLVGLTRRSAGVYRCEVSGETPHFNTVAQEKHIQVYLVPTSGPRISGLHQQYRPGDRVRVNCTSPPSRPEARLQWWVNRQLAPSQDVQGPWRQYWPGPDAVTTTLQLQFTVQPSHFHFGQMTLKCQAIIPPLYQNESVHSSSQEEVTEPPVYHEKSHFTDFGNIMGVFTTSEEEQQSNSGKCYHSFSIFTAVVSIILKFTL